MASALAAGRQAIGSFFEWWFGELAGLVPRRLRAAGRRDRPRLVLLVEGERVTLRAISGTGERPLASGAPADPADQQRLRAALKDRRRGARRATTVRLAHSLGLRRVLDLPLVAEADLHQALRFEMDRITPFKAEEVLFAHRVVQADREQRRLSVEIEVAPRTAAERAFELARELGLDAQRLELAAADGGPGRLDLTPREIDGSGRAGRLNGMLLLLLLVLAVVAVGLPFNRQRTAALELEQEVAAARAEAEKSMQLRTSLETLTRSASFLSEVKASTPMVAAVLAELTRVIPDQAYVSQLQLRERDLQIHGLADTASDLIGRLSASPLFRAPQFRSPVTRDPRNQKERFHIQVQIAEGAG